MPEIWLFGLIFFLIFSLLWVIVEIGIKWAILDKTFVWKTVWHALLNSVFIQLLQILGVALALTLSSQIPERWERLVIFSSVSQNFWLFVVAFLFIKFITDSTISGLFLVFVKKQSKQAWQASIISSFIGAFFLCLIAVIISSP